MIIRTHNMIAAASLLVFALLASDPAYAFRCKSKIVRDGMHEQQVLAVCGQPTSVRHIGYALRGYAIGVHNRYPGGLSTGRTYPGYGSLVQEVVVTEYVYNFGPRKLMRRLIFEGGMLVTIETIGYGYIEKRRR
jgi:hypothetical protein